MTEGQDEAAAAVPAAGPAGPEPVRVDARKLESALLALRHPIVSVALPLDAAGVQDARAERRKLLSQIDDYLLPRLRQPGTPILVALIGSTGAGKSTLMNSLAGRQVSATGIRRPTTNSPVLACHPADMHWFAENIFLPTLPRVRQEGLAMPGRDGLLVLAESEGMPRGVALLDTPDIDSVVQAHRQFAHQFLDASDLWLFMTSARRYADAAVWELLQEARQRGAALSIVLSRVPPVSAPQLTAHFEALLDANGLRGLQRFIIAETVVTDGRLPPEVSGPVRHWLSLTAAQGDRRVAVLTQTMAGVLDTFRTRVPALAAEVQQQLTARAQLRGAAEDAYETALGELDQATRNGSLLRGEILARWQDFAGAGDLARTLALRGRRSRGQAGKQAAGLRAQALKDAISVSMQALVAATADRAAESAAYAWQQYPAGRALLSDGKVTGRSSPDLARRTAQAIGAWQDHVMHLVQAEHVAKRSIARLVSFEAESLALVLTVGMLAGTGEPEAGEAARAPHRLLTSLLGASLLRDLDVQARADLRERSGVLFAAEIARFAAPADAAGAPGETAAAELCKASQAVESAR